VSAVARAAAGPVIAALVVLGLLAAWVTSGGAGTLTQVRLQVSLAAVPMRAFTAQTAAANHTATTFLTVRNLTGTADQIVSVRSPMARQVLLTVRSGPAGPRTTVPSLTVPGHGTLVLSPFGNDVVLQDPQPYETRATVPLVLTFRHAGTVTVQAPVTAPGIP
jgi:copper(I)-binding protein